MYAKKRRLWPVILLLVAALGVMALSGWLWYDSSVDRSGWVERDGVTLYRDFHGHPVSGWVTLDGNVYYLDDAGVPRTGWQELEGKQYCFDDRGAMLRFWQTLSGDTYFFGSDGVMETGWLELDGNRYYLADDGTLLTGWQEIEGQQRYFDSDGAMALEFATIDGSVYFFGSDGVMETGDQEIEGLQFYFHDDGVMHTGWREDGDLRRYYYADGAMATDWAEIGGELYFFGDEGTVHTGWYQDGEYTYYLREDGTAATGPQEIDGQTHFFTPKGIEVILVNRKHKVPSYYEMDLVTVVDWHRVDSRCYEALVQMLADCNAAGIEYTFNSGYRSLNEQALILETRTKEYMAAYDLPYDSAKARALKSVAVPGTSEHHLGLAVDLLGDEATAWLSEHCWDYGFILRYTAEKEEITGFIDEPWHFRYVGTRVSLDMKDSGLCLEEYLGAV